MFAITYLLILTFNWIIQIDGIKRKDLALDECKSYYNTSLKKKVYTEVAEEATFPGGPSEQQRFLNKNLRYPQEQANSEPLQSRLIIKFIVDTNGSINSCTINGKSGKDNLSPFESETFNVVKRMPRWIPGKCKGKIVPSEITIPVTVCFYGND